MTGSLAAGDTLASAAFLHTYPSLPFASCHHADLDVGRELCHIWIISGLALGRRTERAWTDQTRRPRLASPRLQGYFGEHSSVNPAHSHSKSISSTAFLHSVG